MSPIPCTLKRLLTAIVVAGLSTACASAAYDTPNSLGVMPPRQPTPVWLGAIGSSSSAPIRGAAAATPSQVPGWTHVMLSLDNTTAGGLYTWSLRTGTCSAEGNVVGPVDRYSQFAIHADGSGAAEAVIPAPLSPDASYAVVARPVSTSSAPGACADLARTTM